MTYEQIRYEVADGILTITLYRPDKLNAFTGRMLIELLDALDRADADDDVRAVIFTGAGRAFCAGADISGGSDNFVGSTKEKAASMEAHRDGGGLLTLRLFDLKKPVIAAINGAAVGVGVTMTLPMDVRIAADSARMGFVFVKRGIVPEAASSWFLPRLVGISQAAEWVYTGRIFDAQEALAGRLVSRVVPADKVIESARALAREMMSDTSAISVALARQLMWKMLGADHPMEAHKLDSPCIYWTAQSADAIEGVTSFLQKRPPQFRMRPSRDMPPFYPWWRERSFGGK
jgi:enoyl-CoA hydratase/carnithine racemase